MTRYVPYGDEATDYLKAHDRRLGAVIVEVGHVWREMDDDLFSAGVHHIIGQQISSAAQRSVWERLRTSLGEVTPELVCATSAERLQSCGMTFRKADYISDFARKVYSGDFDLEAVARMGDDQAIAALTSLRGIGRWTAEMLLLFCLGRPDILAFDDLAIRRGLRMVYHHREITRQRFERYRRRYSPFGSVASLYLWAVAAGDVPGFERDFAQKGRRGRAGR